VNVLAKYTADNSVPKDIEQSSPNTIADNSVPEVIEQSLH
jgi:hypothetical protein